MRFASGMYVCGCGVSRFSKGFERDIGLSGSGLVYGEFFLFCCFSDGADFAAAMRGFEI